MAFCVSGQNPGSWSVAATVNEPSGLLQAFVAHHLALGAAAVTLYFDAPNPEATAALAGTERCRIIECDAEYWQLVRGKGPHGSHIRRQLDNICHAYETCQSDWLLHLDGDEFLQADAHVSVRDMLASMPHKLDCVKVRNSERIYPADLRPVSIFDGVFRLPFYAFWSDADDLVTPEARPFLYRGVTAYAQGKSFTRTGRNLLPGIHSARGIEGHANHWLVPGMEVLHFDGLTPLHWATKLMRFAEYPGHLSEKNFGAARLAQIQHVLNKPDAARRIYDLHQLLKVEHPEQLTRLRAMGLLSEPETGVSACLAEFGLTPDLSVAGFDRELRRRNPQYAGLIDDWTALEI